MSDKKLIQMANRQGKSSHAAFMNKWRDYWNSKTDGDILKEKVAAVVYEKEFALLDEIAMNPSPTRARTKYVLMDAFDIDDDAARKIIRHWNGKTGFMEIATKKMGVALDKHVLKSMTDLNVFGTSMMKVTST